MFSLISNGIIGECIHRAVYLASKEFLRGKLPTNEEQHVRISRFGKAFIGSIFAYSS